jgi:hypothetical protein
MGEHLMNTQLLLRKRCYRCPNMVPVTPAESDNGQEHACCETCRAKLAVELSFACTVIPRSVLIPAGLHCLCGGRRFTRVSGLQLKCTACGGRVYKRPAAPSFPKDENSTTALLSLPGDPGFVPGSHAPRETAANNPPAAPANPT